MSFPSFIRTTTAYSNFAFVFLHSYSSCEDNWQAVMIGTPECPGRLLVARHWGDSLGLPIIANDSIDRKNAAFLQSEGLKNLATARNTRDEVDSALKLAKDQNVVFVSSPDHLPRVVRDVMAAGGWRSVFVASAVPFSKIGPVGVEIVEPSHRLPDTFDR